jgi:hypothetical protein
LGGDAISIRVCFIATGCSPHNRQVAIAGNAIRVTYTQAELPGCVCVIPTFEFSDALTVNPIAPGRYTVTVVVINCGEERIIGTAEVTLEALPAVPMLGGKAIAILILLTAFTAVWSLRGQG